jgi:ribose-phosphate pyrophosphokinase
MTAILLSGSANPALAHSIAEHLGLALGACLLERFPDGEVHLAIKESVRGRDVYLVQPTSPPGDAHLIELLLLADACRRAGADQVTAVMPYFAYARQDRRVSGREPVAARVMAQLIEAVGVDRVITVDPHTDALEGFFAIPIEHLSAVPLLADAVKNNLKGRGVVVAPDLGAVKLAQRYAHRLGLPMVSVHKARISAEDVQVRAVRGDVRGLAPVIVDDMLSTGATVEASVRALLGEGCEPTVTVVASHGIFAGPARVRLRDLPIARVVTTDSVPPTPDLPLPVEVVPLAPLLSKMIRRLHYGEPIGGLISED